MTIEPAIRDRRRLVFGVLLVGAGLLLTLGQLGAFGVLPLRAVWRWWPAILILMGMAHIIAPERPRQVASGFSEILFGLWFFACTYHWYGLRYSTAWPLLLVIGGGTMLLSSVIEGWARKNESEERHA